MGLAGKARKVLAGKARGRYLRTKLTPDADHFSASLWSDFVMEALSFCWPVGRLPFRQGD